MIYVLSGGQTGATLTVTSSGAGTITVSNTSLGKSYSKSVTAGGSAVFKGLATGTWTVQLSNGAQTSTKTITITSDYSTNIAYFSATIKVTYPAKSKCVIKNSSGTQVASNTNTGTSAKTWTATVNATGTYTVTATATDGSEKSKSQSVEITTEGQSESVQLTYPYYLLKDGVFNSSLGSLEKTSYVSFSSGIINGTQNSEYCAAFSFANKITIPNNAVIKMRITQSSYVTYNGTKLGFTFGISTSNSLPQHYADYVFSAKKQTNDIVSNFTEYSLDLSAFIGQSFYIKATAAADFKVNQIWFE